MDGSHLMQLDNALTCVFATRMVITPIPTWYDGCLFRSRAEARFAAFLNVHNESWRYEPQGYRLGNNDCYLPDFWLPRIRGYLEVKGLYDWTVRKPQRFAEAEIEEHAVYLAVGGIPGQRQLTTAGWWDRGLGVQSLTPGYRWDEWFPPDSPEVLAACEAARSERFGGGCTAPRPRYAPRPRRLQRELRYRS